MIPDKGPFWLAILSCAAILFGVDFYFQHLLAPERIANSTATRILAHEKDDHGHLMMEVLSIRQSEQLLSDQRPTAYIVGGSTLREGLLPDPILMREYLPDGMDLEIRTLYSFDQTMAETARVVTNLPLKPGDLVVIDINPRRLGFGPETFANEAALSRLSLLPDDKLAAFRHELWYGWPELKNWERGLFSFWAHRLFVRQWIEGRTGAKTKAAWSALVNGSLGASRARHLFDFAPRPVRQHIRYAYSNSPLPNTKKDEIARRVRDERVDEYFQHKDFSLSLLRVLARDIRSQGANPIMLELPRSKRSVDAYGPVWEDYNQQVLLLGAPENDSHIDLRDMQFSEEDFYDLEHLLRDQRPALSQAVIDGIISKTSRK
ncbi:MAG: hypothetical protein AAFR03_09930 [Pseudomonadota bacterium]